MNHSTEEPAKESDEGADASLDGLQLAAEHAHVAPSGGLPFAKRLLASRDFAILIVVSLLFVFFSVSSPRFLSTDNVIDLFRQVSLLGILAVGMTYLIVAGEFDLSVGSNYGFLVTVIGFLVVLREADPWLAALMVIGLGMVIGVVNGLLVTAIGLPSFIVTLGSMLALRGAANLVSGGFPISAKNTDLLFYKVIGGRLLGAIPYLILWMVAIMMIGGVILSKTRFGYSIYAVGGNVESARYTGVSTRLVKLACFIITGGLCGLIAALLFGWIGLAPSNTGSGLELRVIAAVVLGGTGLFGGRGTIFGTFVGSVLLGMLANGLILLGVKEFWDGVAAGVLILIVAGLDLVARHGSARMLAAPDQ